MKTEEVISRVGVTIAIAGTEENPFPPSQSFIIPNCDSTDCPAEYTISNLQSRIKDGWIDDEEMNILVIAMGGMLIYKR